MQFDVTAVSSTHLQHVERLIDSHNMTAVHQSQSQHIQQLDDTHDESIAMSMPCMAVCDKTKVGSDILVSMIPAVTSEDMLGVFG